MTVSSSTNRVSYSGNGSLTAFAYTFKVFDEDDLTVILRASDGTETVQTITTNYTVSGVGDAGGGNVTFTTAPASGVTVVILREQPLTQGLDLVPNDPFPAQSLEDQLDKLTFITQQHSEELGRAIKASKTNVITGAEFTISATDRANKVFAFDSSGDVSITSELGVYRGDWAASVAYNQRDIVKDTSNNNIYLANTAHTSSGSTPLSSNADIAKWDLLVDAASATTSATNAAASETAAQTAQTAAETAQTAAETAQTAAETAETNAETAQTAAETAQTAAETAKTGAETAQTAAETALDSFDDRYLGAKSSDPTVDNDGDALVTGALYFNTTTGMKVYDGSSWDDVKPTTAEQTNIDTVAGISANVTTVANNVSGVNSFAERYRVDSSDPTTSLDEGDLAFNTTSNKVRVYNGTAWQDVAPVATGVTVSQITDYTGAAADLNRTDITTEGLTEASKVVTADSNGVVSFDNGTIEEVTSITSSSGAATINLRDGNVFEHDLTENVTYTFSNPAASGRASCFILKVIQGSTARTITWPSSVDWASSTAPTLTTTNDGVDVFGFITVDGGTTYYGFTLGQAMG